MTEFKVNLGRELARRLQDPDTHWGPANRGFAGYVLELACQEIERLRTQREEARRILTVLERTGPMIPIQEAEAITRWITDVVISPDPEKITTEPVDTASDA